MEVFLGQPDSQFVKWCQDNCNIWNKLVNKLEDYPTLSASLPAVGTYLTTSYDIGEDEFVPMEWQILGYNGSIPEYVKYKNSTGEKLYVKSVKSGLLGAITVGDATYVKNTDGSYSTDGNTVTAVGSDIILNTEKNCTYGNNCGWTAPESITVGETVYTFAGYNITLLSKLALGVKYDGKLYSCCQFDSKRNGHYGHSDWSTSMLRIWMSGEGDTSRLDKQGWSDMNDDYFTYGKGIKPLRARFNDNAFVDHIQTTVNRTWVFPDLRSEKILDSNYCEHVVDKFWILGNGNINCNLSACSKDYDYDTSIFNSVFTESTQTSSKRIRNYMTITGGDSGTFCRWWWLRSAISDFNNNVLYVEYNGYVSLDFTNCGFCILPACTIG